MRLIDADAIHKFVDDSVAEGKYGWADGVPYEWKYALAIIDYFPTIDAAPVRRSEWVTDDDNTDDWAEPYCKKCGCFIPRAPAHFCPNCGADMRGETE